MKKLLTLTTLAVCALPALVFAGGTDVTLTTSAVIQVGSYTLNVIAPTAVVQSITVNPTNFTVTLASGSSMTVSSPALYELSSDVQTEVTSSVCSNATSSISLAYSGAGTVTNTITPSSTSCSTAFPGAPTSVSASAGNAQATVSFTAPSQGGSPITSYTVTSSPGGLTASGASSPITVTGLSNGTAYSFTVIATNSSGAGGPSSASNAVTPTAPSTGGGGGGGGGTVPPAILATILAPSASTTAYLNSLATSTVPGCPTNMHCTQNATASTSPSFIFTLSLAVGSQGNEVTQLQKLLVRLGYLTTNPTGYFGVKTEQALKKLQTDHRLTGVGAVGPLTRALLNSLQPSASNVSVQPTANTPSTTKYQFSRNLSIGSQSDDVTKLQTILNTAGFLKVSPTGYFGQLTQDAVKAYQTAHNVSSTGFVGPMTRGELNK